MAGNTTVAVIGGGPLGLMALKNFKESGFDVTLFETRAWVGGIWKYSDDDALSVAETTIYNSSKYRTAISDFPVPDDMDDFPTAQQLHKYFESYCDHFDLWPHIQLNSPVALVKRVGQQWGVEISSPNQVSQTHLFDKVAFSCGTYISPKKPTIEGIEKFAGPDIHAINFHDASQLEGQNVLVVGVHASAQDVMTPLSKHAAKAYASHRSGITFIPRYFQDGSVYDRMPPLGFTVISLYISSWFPSLFDWFMDSMILSISKKAFPNPPASLGTLATTKAPSIAVATPLIASEIYPHFQSGFCEGVPEVARVLGPKTVKLKSGRVLEDIDAIIYCTGYHTIVPVKLEPSELDPYPYPGAPPTLYRNTFPLHPDPNIRNSLAFLGQGAIAFPGFSPHEMINLAVAQIWLGNSSLPPLAEMQKWHRNHLGWREHMTKKYNAQSTFYTVFLPQADHSNWVDSCAGLGIRRHFGLVERWIRPEAWKFWWRNRELYNLCLWGISSPAIWRLFDQGKRKAWRGAAQQIFLDNESIRQQQKRRQKVMEEN